MERHKNSCALSLAIVLLAIVVAPASAAGPTVTVHSSLETLRPAGPLSGPASATLRAARNEFESFQVAVSAGELPVGDLRIELITPLAGPGGTIPAANVTIYREQYLGLGQPSDLEGATGPWPDALIPAVDPYYGERRDAFPVDVPAGESRVAWVDVLVPPKQPAGVYRGSLLVRASGMLPALVPVELTVHDFTLPSTSTLKSSFGSFDNLCKAHYGDGCDELRGWEINSLYARAGLENRISLSDPAYRAPVGGAVEAFRRYVQPLLDGRSPHDEAGLWSPVRLDGAALTSIEVANRIRAWKREAREGKFADRAFLYACDEPGRERAVWRRCKQRAGLAGRSWRTLDVLVTASLASVRQFRGRRLIDILVPLVNQMDDKPGSSAYSGNQRPGYEPFLARRGRRLWLYTSCTSHGCAGGNADPYWAGWPSYVIDQPASEHRAMGLLAYEYGAGGELYYAVDWDLTSAWQSQPAFGGNGDGTLFYPGTPAIIGGTHHIPIESIRLKRIRDGREDFEYAALAARSGRQAEAVGVARSLFPSMYSTDVTPAAFEQARLALAGLVAGGLGP